MKKALLIFLFTISPAFADDQNVYDLFRQLPNTDNAVVDEQTTALIKRHMANLLYPEIWVRSLDQKRTQNFSSRLSRCKSRWGHRRLEP